MTEEELQTALTAMLFGDHDRMLPERKRILSAFAELRAERDLAREALNEVEADNEFGECHWCHGLWEDAEYERNERGIHTFPAKIIKPAVCHHKPDCLRQRALGITKGE